MRDKSTFARKALHYQRGTLHSSGGVTWEGRCSFEDFFGPWVGKGAPIALGEARVFHSRVSWFLGQGEPQHTFVDWLKTALGANEGLLGTSIQPRTVKSA